MSAMSFAEAARIMRELRAGTDFVYLYAIQAGDYGPVKLGLAKNPAQRLKTLQVGNAVELRGLAAWRVHPVEERFLHDEFAEARIRGEWFRPTPELLEYVLYEGGIFCDWGDE